MSFHEMIRQNSVVVNGGSGVLFNGLTKDFSYVLTANHVLIEDNSVFDVEGKTIEVLEVFPHHSADADCAILKVTYQENSQSSFVKLSDMKGQVVLNFAGFPTLRRKAPKASDRYSLAAGTLNSRNVEEFVMSLLHNEPKDNIVGMSGGGIYYIKDEYASLVGVEFRMDGLDENEQFGKVVGFSIQRFIEIIEANDLPQLIPFHLNCFSNFMDRIFDFNVIETANVARLRDQLLSLPNEWVSNGALPTPHYLLEKYSYKLLMEGESIQSLHDEELWTRFLEFLIICSIIDEQQDVNNDYISSQDKKRRLLYTRKKENWLRSLRQILEFAKKNLDDEGVVLITSPQSDAFACPPKDFLDNIIDNISTVPNRSRLTKIDDVKNYSTYKIRHFNAMHNECVTKIEMDYGAIKKISDQIEYFKGKYRGFFN